MNQLLGHYVSVQGLDNALKMARALVEQNYQVMVQLDDCDIYIVAYETNERDWGNKFCSLTDEEMYVIQGLRDQDELAAARKRVKEALDCCDMCISDLGYQVVITMGEYAKTYDEIERTGIAIELARARGLELEAAVVRAKMELRRQRLDRVEKPEVVFMNIYCWTDEDIDQVASDEFEAIDMEIYEGKIHIGECQGYLAELEWMDNHQKKFYKK